MFNQQQQQQSKQTKLFTHNSRMLENPPAVEYCAVCSKCLNDEPVPVRCEICKNKICNDCRSIPENRKRTIIATSLTKSGGGKAPSGRLLSMLGSKLSVLSAFRSGLSKESFEFDEMDEEELDRRTSRRSPTRPTADESNRQFDKYFDNNQSHADQRHQTPDAHQSDRHHLDSGSKHQFKHNKIEKQLSFQYANERRRRLSTNRLNEGGSLDIDNCTTKTTSGALLTVPIDQQQQQSRSDSQLNRTNSIERPSSRTKTNSFEAVNQSDANNNNSIVVHARLKIPQLNRMHSIDDRSIAATTQIRKSTMPLERSNTVDQCENTERTNRARLDNLKQTADDFILSICVMCAKQM